MNTQKICQGCGTALNPEAPGGLCAACLMKVAMGSGVEGEAGPGKRGFTPPRVEDLAGRFPGLEIIELIGRGGMGAVYKARQKELDRIVALKILPPDIGQNASFAERFAREAKALAKLNHPGIVTIYDFGRADGLYFFLMEFVDGVTLRQLLHKGRVSPREALAIVPEICDALQYAHDQGIVHRDIKPDNILLDRRGRVKVADFGLAKLIGGEADALSGREKSPAEELTEAGKVMGTPNYMAPEQLSTPQEVDHRADIYSLGVVFYQMLTGELPGARIEPPSKKVQVDVRLDEVVLRALEQNPERRYPQASVLKTQVETLAGGAGSPPPIPPGASQAGSESPSNKSWPVRFTADSVRTQFLILAWAWWIGFPISIPGEFMLWPAIVWVPALTLATVLWCMQLYRHWLLLQGYGARTTPGRAVGFGFIPVFWFYWWFVALAGLATDNNRHFREVGITSVRLSYRLAVTYCVLSVLYCTVGLIPGVGAVLTVPIMIVGFILMLQQRNCILAMLKHRGILPVEEDRFAASPQRPAPAGARLRWLPYAAIALGCILLAIVSGVVLLYWGFSPKNRVTIEELAESPQELRRVSTRKVIEATVAKPEQPWGWQELERRAKTGQLAPAEADRLLNDLTAWLKREHPEGYPKPLSWAQSTEKVFMERKLVSDQTVFQFLQAFHGKPAIGTLPRLRQGEAATLLIACNWRNEWTRSFFGHVMLNEMQSVWIDDILLTNSSPVSQRRAWGDSRFVADYVLPELAPGKYTLRCEVKRAILPEADLPGLPHNAPSSEWPIRDSAQAWTDFAETELKIFPADAQIVRLIDDPAVDPSGHWRGVSKAFIRPRESGAVAVLIMDTEANLPVPVSFNVELRIGNKTYPAGVFYLVRSASGITYTGGELTVNIDPPSPEVKTMEVRFKPNPAAVEHLSNVDAIWGEEMVYVAVPVVRQDLLAADRESPP